jgi:hypothetical protein
MKRVNLLLLATMWCSNAAASGRRALQATGPAGVTTTRPDCGIEFCLPPGWEITVRSPCQILMRPVTWPARVATAEVIEPEWPVRIEFTDEPLEAAAPALGFFRDPDTFQWLYVNGHAHGEACRLQWCGVEASPSPRTYYRNGRYAGVGDGTAYLIRASGQRTALLTMFPEPEGSELIADSLVFFPPKITPPNPALQRTRFARR